MNFYNGQLKIGNQSHSHFKLYNNRINNIPHSNSSQNLDSFIYNNEEIPKNETENYNYNNKQNTNRRKEIDYLNLNNYDSHENINLKGYNFKNRRNKLMKIKSINKNTINTIDNIDDYLEALYNNNNDNDNEIIKNYKKKVQMLEYKVEELKKENEIMITKLNKKNNSMNNLLNKCKSLENKYFLILENYKLMDINSMRNNNIKNINKMNNNLNHNNININILDAKYNKQNDFYKKDLLINKNNILNNDAKEKNVVNNGSLNKKLENYKKCLNENRNILNNINKIKNENSRYISENKNYINKISLLTQKIKSLNNILFEKDEEIKKLNISLKNNKSKDKRNINKVKKL